MNLSGPELRRWYWTMAELQPFARELGLSASGPKATLTDRIAASLDGAEPPPTPPPRPPRAATALPSSLTRSTVVPDGQRSTQQLRAFFLAEIGPAFRFDGHVRSFLAEADGATLDDVIDHWHDTRGKPLPQQSSSLEFNAFTKAWHRAHPNGSADAARTAWQRHRSLPADQRPPLPNPEG